MFGFKNKKKKTLQKVEASLSFPLDPIITEFSVSSYLLSF